MAEEAAISMVGNAVDSLLSVAIQEISYMCNCAENVETFRGVKQNLINMKRRVQQQIDKANDNGDDLLPGVQEWMEKADEQIRMAEQFIAEEAVAKKTCFNLRLCVNFCTLHHYGKEVITKGRSLLQHQEDGKPFEACVSIPARSPGLLDVYQRKNLDDIITHKKALGEIIQAIIDVNKQIIGVFGFGGVGKTTLATEALAMVKNDFKGHVFTTISRDINVEKIRKEIEPATKRILKGDKMLIILDDMWDALKLEDLGIRVGENCKILFTTRKRHVCDAMDAHASICINTLPKDEAWILFKHVTGERIETDNSLKEIALKVIAECGGLPLIIQAVGKALKNKTIDIWEVGLEQLKSHAPSNINSDISSAFNHLKLSYDYLESEEAKSCFLLCSMFPEDSSISLETLVYYMVGLEKFNNLKSIEDARNRVRIAIDTLESSFLLLNGHDKFHTKMHAVVHDVALLIASEGEDKFLVEAGKSLTKWLPRKECPKSYTGISLMNNKICTLPHYELYFPHLKILLLQGNVDLSNTSDEFVRGMKEARVLDLAHTAISSLPQSLKLLTKLRMLNLGGMRNPPPDISVLGKLGNLEILIFNGDAIEEIPQEIGELENLRRLEIQGRVKFHHSIVSKLIFLEELCVGIHNMNHDEFLKELINLQHLTILHLWLPCFDDIPQGFDFGKLQEYKELVVQIGGSYRYDIDISTLDWKHQVILGDLHLKLPFSESAKRLIEVCAAVNLVSTENLKNIVSILYQQGFNNLDSISLNRCSNVSCLVDRDQVSTLFSSNNKALIGDRGGIEEKFFSKLKHLHLNSLIRLKVIWNCPVRYISFSNLLTLNIDHCPSLVRLFSVRVAQGLFNLQKLEISYCDGLKEAIFGGDKAVDHENIEFPSLAKISLKDLYGLKSFYSGNSTIRYPSLVEVIIINCFHMKIWGQGIHETPSLKFVGNNMPLAESCTINEAVGMMYEP